MGINVFLLWYKTKSKMKMSLCALDISYDCPDHRSVLFCILAFCYHRS
ncbi:hypothetical protein F383_18962 [Gossypium arboreum]|uniref:Uncharacterized protein n=1 Tax=Gossypium arboreum TaxID=29729 RepID=A0A0B0NR67_GOSAR|nr:hypothetical protein F383_18962 [Gossypium arboreum]